jgi:hypothetical protein
MTPLKSSLINFIAPRSTIETFDDVCSYHAQSRTSVLLKLMRDYIQEQSPIIQTEIQSIRNLKNGLSNFVVQKNRHQSIRPIENKKFHGYKLRENLDEPILFFSDGFKDEEL